MPGGGGSGEYNGVAKRSVCPIDAPMAKAMAKSSNVTRSWDSLLVLGADPASSPASTTPRCFGNCALLPPLKSRQRGEGYDLLRRLDRRPEIVTGAPFTAACFGAGSTAL